MRIFARIGPGASVWALRFRPKRPQLDRMDRPGIRLAGPGQPRLWEKFVDGRLYGSWPQQRASSPQADSSPGRGIGICRQTYVAFAPWLNPGLAAPARAIAACATFPRLTSLRFRVVFTATESTNSRQFSCVSSETQCLSLRGEGTSAYVAPRASSGNVVTSQPQAAPNSANT